MMTAKRPNWRVRLDARISWCEGCAHLIFDGRCSRCDEDES